MFENLPSWKAAGITAGFTVFILANVTPFEVPNDVLVNVSVDDELNYIKSKQVKEWSDSTGTYFVRFIDHKVKSDISPIEFAKDEIKAILLNKRKLVLIAKMKDWWHSGMEREWKK